MIVLAFFVLILTCSRGALAEDAPAPEAATARRAAPALSKKDFFRRLEELYALALDCASTVSPKARGNGRRATNFFTPELYPLAEDLLASYPPATIARLAFSVDEKKCAIEAIFNFLPLFKKRGNNAKIDKELGRVHKCTRYQLVSYCFNAFHFEDEDETGQIVDSHVDSIVKAFTSMPAHMAKQTWYINVAMESELKSFLARVPRERFSGPRRNELECVRAQCEEAVQKLCERKEACVEGAKKRWSEPAKTPEERLKARAKASKKRATYVMEAADPSAFDWEPPCFGEGPGGVDTSSAGAAAGGAGDDPTPEMPGEAENKRARVGSGDVGPPEKE